jgi:hypothetical protein
MVEGRYEVLDDAEARADRAERERARRELAPLEGPDARLAELARIVACKIRRHPLLAIGIAIGIGFAIGGGLSSRLGRAALAAAARHALKELLKQVA